jgi:membrane-bound PQQ-dependent dehydrogenase (glucose/quinate/shikimate family)
LPTLKPLVVILSVLLGLVSIQSEGARQEWRYYGGEPGGRRFSPLAQINTSNVGRLKRAWTYHTQEFGPNITDAERRAAPQFESTPIVVNGVMYLSTPSSRVIALDSTSGKELWTYDPQPGSNDRRRFEPHRGVAYWEGPAADGKTLDRRILSGTFDGRLLALDATTGQLVRGFGQGGAIDLRVGAAEKWPRDLYAVTSPPAIYKDLVIVGLSAPEGTPKGPSGDVRAFDARTGKLAWQFHTVPRPGEPGAETWGGDSARERTGVNAWPPMSVDPDRGLLFVVVGSPAYDFYGGDRKGKNLYGNSLVALKAESGSVVWFFQMVHHDIWDYDPPAQPVLATIRKDGRDVPAVVAVTKMGFVFVFDRETGVPVFPIEERPVPASTVPGEATWPTQPIPVKPPSLVRHSMTSAEISHVTLMSRIYCSALFWWMEKGGLYQPPGESLTLMFPGTLGGATWSGASFDPATGYLFVNVNELGALGAMKEQPAGSLNRYKRETRWGEYARFWDRNEWPCQAPPWGNLAAVDLSRGEIAWKVPLGVVDALIEEGVPPTGAINLGGSIATAGGLVFIAGSADSRFRAFDTKTGRELWVTKLEASGHATPMTFEGNDGKQYVVVAAGGGGKFSKTLSDTVAAYALP